MKVNWLKSCFTLHYIFYHKAIWFNFWLFDEECMYTTETCCQSIRKRFQRMERYDFCKTEFSWHIDAKLFVLRTQVFHPKLSPNYQKNNSTVSINRNDTTVLTTRWPHINKSALPKILSVIRWHQNIFGSSTFPT